SFERIYAEPNQVFRHLTAGLGMVKTCDISNRRLTVARFPDKCGGLIQTVGFITVEIIHEQFVWHLLYDQSLFTGSWELRVIHFLLHKCLFAKLNVFWTKFNLIAIDKF